MTLETSTYLALLEQRIALLGSLATSLLSAREGLVCLDLHGLEQRILEQQKLCLDIHSLDAGIDRIQKQCAAQLGLLSTSSGKTVLARLPSPEGNRIEVVLTRLHQAQSTVKKLNREHQLLLRRSRRTVGALLNSYHSFALTYHQPRPLLPAGRP